jgi:hypothetical protein
MFHRLQRRHDFASEEAHAFLGEVAGEGAELEEAEEVADAEDEPAPRRHGDGPPR